MSDNKIGGKKTCIPPRLSLEIHLLHHHFPAVTFKAFDQMGMFHFILLANNEPHRNHLLKKEKGRGGFLRPPLPRVTAELQITRFA